MVLLRWTLPRRWVGPLLLVSSYVFYLSWGLRYGFLIGGMTGLAWLAGLTLERWQSRRRAALTFAIGCLLSILAYFKYSAFALSQGAALLRLVGIGAHDPHLRIVLPLGISFFTFELVSYVVDVYRGEPAERSIVRFALYVAYYPHLVAGPIVRAHELLPQLHAERRFDGDLFAEGVFIALVGYVRKMVIADNLAPWADEVFAHPQHYSTFGVWMGAVAYTGQIFCDFAGYTDIARGASMMLGYPLPENFDYPYLSTSITEFWRRWHMTLSRWLRDYLYIALGGNRHGRIMQYRNLFLTMLLGGLWHGANWTFVAWGALHGVLLALHKAWDTLLRRTSWAERARAYLPYRAVAGGSTLLAVMVAWVFFRASSFSQAGQVLHRMATRVPGLGELGVAARPARLTTAIAFTGVLVVVHFLGYYRVAITSHRLLPPIARGLVWAGLIATCYLLAESRAAFIYFQF